MAKLQIPLVIEFRDLTEGQRILIGEHPSISGKPIQSREAPQNWIVAFNGDDVSRDELFDLVNGWACVSGLPPARRRT